MIDPSTSRFLDAARWMAALAVVVSHTCALSLVAERHFVDQGFGVVLLSTLEYAGHLAVVVFFVISGYLVGGRELWRVRTGGKFDLGRYAVQRFSRIYTVLVPALLLAAALDAIGQHWANGSLLYTQPASANIGSLMFAIAKRSDIWTFLGNLLMLQTLVVKPLGGDGPLWSLANEWWYYTLFALIMISASPHRRLLLRAVTLAAAGMLLKVLPTQMALWFSIWLLGVGLAVVGPSVRGLGFRTALVLMAAGFGLSLFGMRWTGTLPHQSTVQTAARLLVDLLIAASFAVALLSARYSKLGVSGRLHARLAGFSFTLYATHMPVLILLAALAHDKLGVLFGQALGVPGLLTVVLLVATIVAFAWAFASITESKTAKVRLALTSASMLLTSRRGIAAGE